MPRPHHLTPAPKIDRGQEALAAIGDVIVLGEGQQQAAAMDDSPCVDGCVVARLVDGWTYIWLDDPCAKPKTHQT